MLFGALMELKLMKAAYAHAIEQGYRFYSYGDSSLLLPQDAFRWERGGWTEFVWFCIGRRVSAIDPLRTLGHLSLRLGCFRETADRWS